MLTQPYKGINGPCKHQRKQPCKASTKTRPLKTMQRNPTDRTQTPITHIQLTSPSCKLKGDKPNTFKLNGETKIYAYRTHRVRTKHLYKLNANSCKNGHARQVQTNQICKYSKLTAPPPFKIMPSQIFMQGTFMFGHETP